MKIRASTLTGWAGWAGWTTVLATVALLAFGAQPALADEDPLGTALRKAVSDNLAAYDREDVAGTLSTIDSDSPDYESTKDALAAQFKDLDVTTSLVAFTLIGHDDEFAVARVKVKTTGKAGSGFTDNTVDSIMVFHMQDGSWKLWGEEVLGVSLP